MKLLISEKIYEYRKKNDMTQEELAGIIGVSAQAVSGWERACGYPDITLLPGIAHALGISIDELMGNDELGIREDIDQFFSKLRQIDSKEKLLMAIEYYRKYPDNYEIADALITIISGWGFANNPEYLTILREASERVIAHCTDNVIRHNAIEAMSLWADDTEADRWLEMNPKNYALTYGEIYEERLWIKGRNEQAREWQYACNLSLMLHIIGRKSHHSGDPERSIAHNAYLRSLIGTFGENGSIPDGWLNKYAFITLQQAAGFFGAGETEKGFALFDEAITGYKKLFLLPDGTPLNLGNHAFFGGITLLQYRAEGQFDTFKDRDGNEVQLREGEYYIQSPPFLYNVLTQSNRFEWCKWFDTVRDDPRFIAAVSEAKMLADAWMV